MNFAFLIRSKAALALHRWTLNLVSTHSPGPVLLRDPVTTGIRVTTVAPAAVHRMRPSPAARPLRVMRMVESGQACADVGRIVISGRMADVCAELDRLVAREAAENGRVGRAVSPAC